MLPIAKVCGMFGFEKAARERGVWQIAVIIALAMRVGELVIKSQW
jgi:hypothetical protein